MVIDAGLTFDADIGGERRHPVVVLSSAQAIRASGRVVVAPAVAAAADETPSPWRIEGFAVDRLVSTNPDRLRRPIGNVETQVLRQMRVAARHLL